MSRAASPELSAGPEASAEVPSFEALFEANARLVWRVLARLGIPEADLPDVCQDVFVSAHRLLPTFENRCAVSTWLYGISVRVAATHRRRLLRRREQIMPEAPEPATPALPVSSAEAALYRERLEGVLYALPEPQASVFILYELEELTMPEIAAALGYPLQSAYSRLYAARKAVLAAFGERKGTFNDD